MTQSPKGGVRARACVAVAAAATLAACASDAATQSGGAIDPTPSQAAAAPAARDGSRLVGFADLAIEVPQSWGTNAAKCGTPTRDTVEIDVGGVRGCLAPRPEGVDSVTVLHTAEQFELGPAEDVVIDGRAARREKVTCADENGTRVCRAAVHFADARVAFRAASSTGPAEVAEILDRIRALPGSVGVPGFTDDNHDLGEEDAGEAYLDELREAGLALVIRQERRPGLPEGHIRETVPPPGTMLRPGDTVEVVLNPAYGGLADQVNVSVRVDGPDEAILRPLDDEQVRAGATVQVPVGGGVTFYGKGPDLSYQGEWEGDSLAFDSGGHPGAASVWRVDKPGTTELTLTVVEDGGDDPDTVGVLTVIAE